MAFIFMQQSGDGLVQGDRNRIDISGGPGSAIYITMQAATDGEYDVIAPLYMIATPATSRNLVALVQAAVAAFQRTNAGQPPTGRPSSRPVGPREDQRGRRTIWKRSAHNSS